VAAAKAHKAKSDLLAFMGLFVPSVISLRYCQDQRAQTNPIYYLRVMFRAFQPYLRHLGLPDARSPALKTLGYFHNVPDGTTKVEGPIPHLILHAFQLPSHRASSDTVEDIQRSFALPGLRLVHCCLAASLPRCLVACVHWGLSPPGYVLSPRPGLFLAPLATMFGVGAHSTYLLLRQVSPNHGTRFDTAEPGPFFFVNRIVHLLE
jgi:hypothetical protein